MPKNKDEERQQQALARREEIKGDMAVAGGFDAADSRGKTNIDAKDRILPRIAIAQDLSPQLKEEKAEYIEGLKFGQLFNTLTGENYGQGPIEFIIIDMQKRAIEFDADNNVVDFNVPWDDPRCEFTDGPDGKRIKPVATRFYDYILLLQGDPEDPLYPTNEMVVLSLKRAQMPIAKKLNALMSVRPGAAWAGRYRMAAFTDHKGNFTYGNIKISPSGPTDPRSIAIAEAAYALIQQGTFTVDRRGEGDTGDEGGTASSTNGAARVEDDSIPF